MLEAGQKFAHFTIVKLLGVGGMGVVYLAEDLKLKRKVALKVLPADLIDNKERLERFHREAKMVAQISHQNVMGIYDIDFVKDENGQEIHYLVMEYIEGNLLADHLSAKKLDIGGIIRLAEKISTGLSAAHKLNIVHRDIKSDNIIIDHNGEPKILDFGLAKPLDPFISKEGDFTRTVSQELTSTGKIMGTVSYMSPEQAKGEPVDIRSDIFSFGVLFYRMSTGVFPFTGATQVSTLAKILETRHESPRLKNESIPLEMERIIDKCLQKDPNDRYQDTRDLVVDLRNLRRQFDSGITDTISTITDRPKIKKSFELSKTKASLIIVGLAILLTIIFSGVNIEFNPDSSQVAAQAQSLAILGFENKTGDSELDWLETGLPEIMLTDLAQSNVINLISRERILDCFPDRIKKHSFDDCVKAAKSLGAVSLLSGSFYKFGDKIRIDARLEDLTTGKIILAEKVVGDDPFPLIDSLTSKIIVSLNLQDSYNEKQSVFEFASSPAAYKLYQIGLEKLFTGEYDSSIANFKEAIEIDSTFILPYLRIGMAYIFSNKNQLGLPYLLEAKKREKSLPLRERNMVDFYNDVWVDQDFSSAYTKIQTFISNYPDDKEVRTIYGLFINLFDRDTTKAFAQFDTVLSTDPSYLFVLSNYAEIEMANNNYVRAEEIALQIKKYHPKVVSGIETLAYIYSEMGEIDKAIEEFNAALEISPGKLRSVRNISALYIKKKDFVKAQEVLENVKSYLKNDPYKLMSYYHSLSNLNNWRGKFKKGIEDRHIALDYALETKDSNSITSAYSSLATYYYWLGEKDSSLSLSQHALKWTKNMNQINYPITIVQRFPATAPIVRPIFEEASEVFKSKVPSKFWIVVDQLNLVFNGYSEYDTSAVIDAFLKLSELQGLNGDNSEATYLMVETGRYQDALELILINTSLKKDPTVARLWLEAHYYLGRSYEGVGKTRQAIEVYEEILAYWGNADIQIKEITDTKQRLSKLTG